MSSLPLHRFRISISDVDRGFYDSLDFRVARHHSENDDFLLTRTLAYALNFESGLEFSAGLCNPDDPAIWLKDSNGIALWIDIGNPSARRLHRSAKASRRVRVYTYKDVEVLKREAAGERIHRAGEIEIFALPPKFLADLASTLERDNEWSLVHSDGELVLTVGGSGEPLMASLERHSLG
jgi:uncharacterized protein YaeQ